MAIKYGYFNSRNGDRVYDANDVNYQLKRLITNGVYPNPSNNLQVMASTGMNVVVKAGGARLDWKWFEMDEDELLTIAAADVTLGRIDRIVLRADMTNRTISLQVKKGTASSSPAAPSVERSETVYELSLATISIARQTSTITQSMIKDTRMDTNVCGVITGLIREIDTTTIFNQYQASFDEWFETVKTTLVSATLIRQYTSSYTTISQNQTVIPIQISQYNKELDILNVFINGLKLIRDVDYTSNDNVQITLTKGLDINNKIEFEVFKSVDGSEAETVVEEIYELQTVLGTTRITNESGGVKLSLTDSTANVLDSFINLGVGFHTIYASNAVQGLPASASFRFFGHLTNVNTGYLVAMQANGNVYANYLNLGTWTGWKELTTYDSGWIELSLNSGITAYSDLWIPKYRKIGNQVFLKGAVKGITANDTYIAVLPQGFRPLNAHPFAQVTSNIGGNAYFARMQVGTAGSIVMETTSGDVPLSTDFFPLDTSFLID